MACNNCMGFNGLETYPSIPAPDIAPDRLSWRSRLRPRSGCGLRSAGLQLANFCGGFESIHVRHLHVHQNNIERLLAEFLHRFPAVVRATHVWPAFFRIREAKFLVHSVVFGDQDAQTDASPRQVLLRAPTGFAAPSSVPALQVRQ